jgi:hypothetical protein
MRSEQKEKAQAERIKILIIEKEKAEAALRKMYDLVGQKPTPDQFKTLVAMDKLEALLAEEENSVTKTEAMRLQGLNEVLKKPEFEGYLRQKDPCRAREACRRCLLREAGRAKWTPGCSRTIGASRITSIICRICYDGGGIRPEATPKSFLDLIALV